MDKLSRSISTREVVIMHPNSVMNHDVRRYSTSSDYKYNPPLDLDNQHHHHHDRDVKIKKARNHNKIKTNNYIASTSCSSSSKSWNFLDPEMQRKKRVAGYKSYAMEGKMKGSLRKSFKWIKDTCNHVVHGF